MVDRRQSSQRCRLRVFVFELERDIPIGLYPALDLRTADLPRVDAPLSRDAELLGVPTSALCILCICSHLLLSPQRDGRRVKIPIDIIYSCDIYFPVDAGASVRGYIHK